MIETLILYLNLLIIIMIHWTTTYLSQSYTSINLKVIYFKCLKTKI